MVTEGLIQTIASTGIVGVVAALALYALSKRDNELQAEKAGRLEDQKKHAAEMAAEKNARIEDARLAGRTALEMQKEAIVAVTVLAKATERVEEEAEHRERLERELALRGGMPTPMTSIPVQQLPPKGRPPR